MKKLFMLMAAVMSAAIGFSQGEKLMTNPNGLALDSFQNTTAEGPYARVATVTARQVGFTIDLTSLTGTVAGKIYLQGGNKSGKWALPYLDSVTLDPGTNSWRLGASNPQFQFYRLWIVPTGTQLTTYVAQYYIRE